MRNLLIFLGTGLILAAGIAYYLYNKPHRDVASEQPAFELTADVLYDEYEADENTANAKYLDKIVEVSGTVAEVGTNDAGQTNVIIAAENAMLGGVSATFDETPSNAIVEGQALTVKCRCTGKLMDVVLVNCTVSE
jgi:hypothetical protein